MWINLVVFVLTVLASLAQDAGSVPPAERRSRKESAMRPAFHLLVRVRAAVFGVVATIGADLLAGALSA